MLITKRLIGLATCGAVLCTAGPGIAAGLAAPTSNPAGAAAGWAVSIASDSSAARLYPGGAPVRLEFTLTNQSGGDRRPVEILAALSVDPSTGAVRNESGETIRGCLARWFNVALDPATRHLLVKPAGSSRGVIDVTMIDAPVDQDACEGHAPAVTVSVAGD